MKKAIPLSNGYVIEFKAKWHETASWSRIFDFGNGLNADNLLVANNGSTAILNHCLYLSSPNNADYRFYSSTETIVLDQIAEWKIVVTKTSGGVTASLYKNGVSQSITMTSFPAGSIPDRKFSTLYIGKSLWSNDGLFNGDIYYLKITLANGVKFIDIDFSRL